MRWAGGDAEEEEGVVQRGEGVQVPQTPRICLRSQSGAVDIIHTACTDAPGCCCVYSSLVGVLILLFKLKMKLQDSQIVGGGAIAKKITRKTKT